MTIVIGLIGYKNSGKTSLSKLVGEVFYASNYGIIGFSNPLYKMMEVGLGITYEEIQDKARRDEPDPRLGGKSIQYALNTLGTKWGREMIYDDIWVDRSLASIGNLPVYFADNVRYANEYEGIERVGGINIAIVNPLVSDDGTWPEAHIAELQARTPFKVFNDPMNNKLIDAARDLRDIIYQL